MPASQEAIDLALVAARAASSKLATNVTIIDVSERLVITDLFVIASGDNERQVKAIVEAIEEALHHEGIRPARREGTADAHWILLDYVDFVVHVQLEEEREFYGLDRMWKDCPHIPFDDSSIDGIVADDSSAEDSFADDSSELSSNVLADEL